MSKKQALYRKKRQLEKRMILLLFIISYVIIAFSIKKLNAQVKQIQTTIQRIENVRYETSETKSEETEDSGYLDYVSTIGEVEVTKPVKRTWTSTAWALMKDLPRSYNIVVSELKITERAMKGALEQGDILICAMREGDFTAAGHFIVIYGYDEKGFMVNDPNCVARSRRRWTYDEIGDQIKCVWGYRKFC